jgi:hypothetical protein
MNLEKNCLYKIQNKYGISLPRIKELGGDLEIDPITDRAKIVDLKTGEFIYVLDSYIKKSNEADGNFYDLKILTKNTIYYIFTCGKDTNTLQMFIKV